MIEIDPKNPPTQETLTAGQVREKIVAYLLGMSEEEFARWLTNKGTYVTSSIFPRYEYDLRSNGQGGFELTTYHPKPTDKPAVTPASGDSIIPGC